jgi:hypothetical protein
MMMITAEQSEKLITEVKQDILDKGYTHDAVTFADVQENIAFGALKSTDKLIENIFVLRSQENVTAYWDLKVTSRSKLGSIAVPIKKIIRKLVSFYIEPIVAQQNTVNELISASLADLYFDNESMRDRIETLEAENEKLKCTGHDKSDERTPE